MKRVLSFVLALTVLLSIPGVALAAGSEALGSSDVEVVAAESGESTRHEETTWYYRVHNGILQKRLWSLTYGRWLTDWIDIGPYIGG